MKFEGFTKGVKYSAVPAPILNSYLEIVENFAELKTVLRAIWILNNKKGRVQYITQEELCSDRILTRSLLAKTIEEHQKMVISSLAAAVSHSIFIEPKHGANNHTVYFLNTESNRILNNKPLQIPHADKPDSWEIEHDLPGPYTLYEQNIGMITPLIADKIKEAEAEFPTEWIAEAIIESVSMNKRNWAYISSILTNWQIEGKSNGESGKHSRQTRYR